ncbi:MAG TPA: archaeosortase A [Candidatus Methanoperedenaceae archaeon]|nr:archaeosortase A [Candidatus Methanoperedenaceae archaeon]
MDSTILWGSLALLMAAVLVPEGRNRLGYTAGSIGWGLFAVHWSLQFIHFLGIRDYYNVFLTAVIITFSLLMSYMMLKGRDSGSQSRILLKATSTAAIGGIIYYAFVEVAFLKNWIIVFVKDQIVMTLLAFGVPLTTTGNIIYFRENELGIEIILACTAIESIALFVAMILSVDAPLRRRLGALAMSIGIIHVTNVLRTVFIATAYWYEWFGAPQASFYMAHTVIAKPASGLILFAVAYLLLRMMPELLSGILDLWKYVSGKVRDLLSAPTLSP